MVTHDTIELLKECDAGVKMGIHAIDEVKDRIEDHKLKALLDNSRKEHVELEMEIGEMLREHGETEKEPSIIASSMSWLKTNMKMSMNASDNTASDLITDGCNMGVKSLQKYINKYENADEKSKDIANRIIKIEETLSENLKGYL